MGVLSVREYSSCHPWCNLPVHPAPGFRLGGRNDGGMAGEGWE